MTLQSRQISRALRELADPEIAAQSRRFFRTGKGDYGEGDRFLGIRVPVIRTRLRHWQPLAIEEIRPLLQSTYHEERLLALVQLFNVSGPTVRKTVYRFYLANTRHINNWDFVDSSAPQIVGAYLEVRKRRVLYRLARSASLREQRIAILATLHFIRGDDFDDALCLAELLFDDMEDLIHKAVGWMLREIGKRDLDVAKAVLQRCYRHMSRTILRYAIERFPERERRRYLHGRI